uniref:Putative secreted peptide n=1 Tax=Anopheles braziliensis TaxID=58242 RepID=A0A2M3ZQC2_9DIPT
MTSWYGRFPSFMLIFIFISLFGRSHLFANNAKPKRYNNTTRAAFGPFRAREKSIETTKCNRFYTTIER